MAYIALDPNIRQKMHFDFLLSIAFASFASPARLIEAETARVIAADFRFRQLGEKLANEIENSGVSGGVGTGGVADRVLVDVNHFINVVDAEDVIMSGGGGMSPVKLAGQGVVKDLVDQGAFAR